MLATPVNRSIANSATTGSHHQSAAQRPASLKREKTIHYFEKPRQPTEDEIKQIESIARLSKNKSLRRKLINDYELPVSDRESWWRCSIKETPSPLKYNIPGFIKEMNRTQNTYRFKSDGRRLDPTPQQGKGEYLLPGAYGYEDFGQRLKRLHLSYGFKNQELSGFYEKSISNPDLGPFSYETENNLTICSNKEPSKHSFFRSKNKRNIFVPKEGPSPGDYEETPEKPKNEITSVFKSKSGRFKIKEQQTPGPGHYEPISAWINSKQTQDFNTKGQFFTPSAKVHT